MVRNVCQRQGNHIHERWCGKLHKLRQQRRSRIHGLQERMHTAAGSASETRRAAQAPRAWSQQPRERLLTDRASSTKQAGSPTPRCPLCSSTARSSVSACAPVSRAGRRLGPLCRGTLHLQQPRLPGMPLPSKQQQHGKAPACAQGPQLSGARAQAVNAPPSLAERGPGARETGWIRRLVLHAHLIPASSMQECVRVAEYQRPNTLLPCSLTRGCQMRCGHMPSCALPALYGGGGPLVSQLAHACNVT